MLTPARVAVAAVVLTVLTLFLHDLWDDGPGRPMTAEAVDPPSPPAKQTDPRSPARANPTREKAQDPPASGNPSRPRLLEHSGSGDIENFNSWLNTLRGPRARPTLSPYDIDRADFEPRGLLVAVGVTSRVPERIAFKARGQEFSFGVIDGSEGDPRASVLLEDGRRLRLSAPPNTLIRFFTSTDVETVVHVPSIRLKPGDSVRLRFLPGDCPLEVAPPTVPGLQLQLRDQSLELRNTMRMPHGDELEERLRPGSLGRQEALELRAVLERAESELSHQEPKKEMLSRDGGPWDFLEVSIEPMRLTSDQAKDFRTRVEEVLVNSREHIGNSAASASYAAFLDLLRDEVDEANARSLERGLSRTCKIQHYAWDLGKVEVQGDLLHVGVTSSSPSAVYWQWDEQRAKPLGRSTHPVDRLLTLRLGQVSTSRSEIELQGAKGTRTAIRFFAITRLMNRQQAFVFVPEVTVGMPQKGRDAEVSVRLPGSTLPKLDPGTVMPANRPLKIVCESRAPEVVRFKLKFSELFVGGREALQNALAEARDHVGRSEVSRASVGAAERKRLRQAIVDAKQALDLPTQDFGREEGGHWIPLLRLRVKMDEELAAQAEIVLGQLEVKDKTP